ncbi:MAG: lactate racemase domain-containing protein [Planctomycetota bacterium]|jgi:nickel-dependent lactate racemase|nr:lactate racemase domain-containing protein [Planctomycetota bacterium]MDP6502284.1 lactate racemase domain-containing protein [Planctomycetota bacterium]
MTTYLSTGSPETVISRAQQKDHLQSALAQFGSLQRVLIIPPDFTRFHSGAGEITEDVYQLLNGSAVIDILPALGTHSPMAESQIENMFGSVPRDRIHVHDWRNGLVKLGEVPRDFVSEVSGGRVDYAINIELNRMLTDANYDLILSVGQVVPHEVIGMANQNKNIFVGTGGKDTINKTHFLGAVVGMENIMGRSQTAVRAVFNFAEDNFTPNLPIVYALTVRSNNDDGNLVTRGLYIGEGTECFNDAARLSQQVNLDLLDEPLQKVVVFLDPGEFKSTWLGNKSVYRTRMAMADDGELIVLAPGLKEFGEDGEIDCLIRKYGHRGTRETLDAVKQNDDLAANLSAAAHLIHGSSEGRFSITYAPGHLSRTEIESVNSQYADLDQMLERYDPGKLRDGLNVMPDGEEIFYISNPALGLWALREQFLDSQ